MIVEDMIKKLEHFKCPKAEVIYLDYTDPKRINHLFYMDGIIVIQYNRWLDKEGLNSIIKMANDPTAEG
jgi:hypothetical protein